MTVGTDRQMATRRSCSSGGNSSDPPWKVSAIPPRPLGTQGVLSRITATSASAGHRRRCAYRASSSLVEALRVHLDPRPQREGRSAVGRRLVGEERDRLLLGSAAGLAELRASDD